MIHRRRFYACSSAKLLFILSLVVNAHVASLAAAEDASGANDASDANTILRIGDTEVESGELKLIMQESGLSDTESPVARQASAAVLIRQHLAMKSLLRLGGKSIQAVIDRESDLVAKQLTAVGSSLAQAASDRGVSLRAYQRHLAWQIAWREYLKSRLTEPALKSYFESHKDRYGAREYLVSQIFLGHKETEGTDATETSPVKLARVAQSVRESDNVSDAFALAAKQYSAAASANQGGDIGWVSRDGDLPTSVMKAVRQAGVGEVVGPVHSPLGQHVLLVRDTREVPMTWESITDRTGIQRDLTNDLFLDLVRRQQAVDVRYVDETLRPKF